VLSQHAGSAVLATERNGELAVQCDGQSWLTYRRTRSAICGSACFPAAFDALVKE
jgi:hypothetical protein